MLISTIRRHFLSVFFLAAQTMFWLFAVMGAASQAVPQVPESDQARSGEQLFFDNCAACHDHTSRLRSAWAPELVGLFDRPGVTEATVRERILQGRPGLMPSFQYSLTSEEIDDLIAFLKLENLADILDIR